ncbi:MAG TPA: metalloregulator ArsR/SmtB family transcription factor [Microlunatus sp.]|nr:metalloregulator ArsR/SmtB family transcription factor [Microlunatus sp.]
MAAAVLPDRSPRAGPVAGQRQGRQAPARAGPKPTGWIHPIVYDAFVELSTSTDALSRFGHALSDRTRTRVLLRLREEPACPSDLADELGVSRQSLSNHLSCLRGCGLVVAIPDGRRTRYELADSRIGHALDDLVALVLVVDPECCGGEVIDVTAGAAESGVSAS